MIVAILSLVNMVIMLMILTVMAVATGKHFGKVESAIQSLGNTLIRIEAMLIRVGVKSSPNGVNEKVGSE